MNACTKGNLWCSAAGFQKVPLGEPPGERGVAGRLGEGRPDSPTPNALSPCVGLLGPAGLEEEAWGRASAVES